MKGCESEGLTSISCWCLGASTFSVVVFWDGRLVGNPVQPKQTADMEGSSVLQ